jgi:hypothetical protein
MLLLFLNKLSLIPNRKMTRKISLFSQISDIRKNVIIFKFHCCAVSSGCYILNNKLYQHYNMFFCNIFFHKQSCWIRWIGEFCILHCMNFNDDIKGEIFNVANSERRNWQQLVWDMCIRYFVSERKKGPQILFIYMVKVISKWIY